MAPSDAIGRNEAATLGVSVNTDTSKDPADGVDRLLGCVRADAKDQTTCRTAVVALERFFSERLCRGDLRVAPTTPATTRFGEQYKAFVRRLCAILADEIVADEDGGDARARRSRAPDGASGGAAAAVSPRTQVLALRAVMELARSEQPGKFNNEMYERALRAMVTGGAFSPEMLGALKGRYLRCHDVRHYTYAAVGRMADEFRRDCGAARRRGTSAGGTTTTPKGIKTSRGTYTTSWSDARRTLRTTPARELARGRPRCSRLLRRNRKNPPPPPPTTARTSRRCWA